MLKAQATMKKYVDGKRRELQFQVGELVLVQLQPNRQTSVVDRASNKLWARYFGPFRSAQTHWQSCLLVWSYQPLQESMMSFTCHC